MSDLIEIIVLMLGDLFAPWLETWSARRVFVLLCLIVVSTLIAILFTTGSARTASMIIGVVLSFAVSLWWIATVYGNRG